MRASLSACLQPGLQTWLQPGKRQMDIHASSTPCCVTPTSAAAKAALTLSRRRGASECRRNHGQCREGGSEAGAADRTACHCTGLHSSGRQVHTSGHCAIQAHQCGDRFGVCARPTRGKRMGSCTSRWQAEIASTCHWKLTTTEYVVLAVSPDRGQLVVAGEGWTGEQLWEKQAPAGLVGQMLRLKDVQPAKGARVGGVTVALAAVWVIEGLFTVTLGALQRRGREEEEMCEGCNTIARPLASAFWRRNMVLQPGASSSMWRPLGTCVVQAVRG